MKFVTIWNTAFHIKQVFCYTDPPGTGKTSIIKGIADYINYDIHILNVSKLQDIEKAIFALPPKTILVIEDIDTEYSTNKRHPSVIQQQKPRIESNNEENINSSETKEETFIPWKMVDLSDILNSIDGIYSVHGRILIMTTNHIEKLDDALIRPGRIDIKIEVTYIDTYAYQNFFKCFYPDYVMPMVVPISNLSPASLQNIILNNLQSPEEVLRQTSQPLVFDPKLIST